MSIKVSLHNHTDYYSSSVNSIDHYKNAFDQGKIDKIAITDHDYIQSAKVYQRIFGEDRIIIGEEISTTDGDVIGLFLKKFVPSGLSAQRTIELIKAQNGIVYIPHPFAPKGLGQKLMDELVDQIDVVEIFNGWSHRSIAKLFRISGNVNKKAEEWAKQNNKPGIVGSDSHFPSDIGNCYTEMEDFDDQESFLHSLNGDVNHVKKNNPTNLYFIRTAVKKFFRKDFLKFIR